jgi:exodeoxyribonuclease VII large subunit
MNLTRDMVRAARFQLMNTRARVQEAAMSRGFDDVQARLREAMQRTNEAGHRLETIALRSLDRARRRAASSIARLSPVRLSAHLADARVRLGLASAKRDALINARLEDARARFGLMVASLDALSPLGVLKRGYAIAQDERGKLLLDASAASIGDSLRLRLAEGSLRCRVLEREEAFDGSASRRTT